MLWENGQAYYNYIFNSIQVYVILAKPTKSKEIIQYNLQIKCYPQDSETIGGRLHSVSLKGYMDSGLEDKFFQC